MVTTFTDAVAGRVATHILQGRTDNTGSAQTDVDGQDLRVANEALTGGVLNRADGFQVTETAGAPSMAVDVGSGTVGDVAVVEGTDPQQGNYRVSWPDATTEVTVPAADLVNPRIDEIYLVVEDTQFDSSGRTLARLALRDGTPAGAPTAPGPDGNWTAFLKLAEILVGAAATEIVNADITDSRVAAEVTLAGFRRVGVGAIDPGFTHIDAPAGSGVALKVDGVNELVVSSTGANFQSNDITGVGSFDAASQAWEVDDSTEVPGPVNLTGSFATVASVSLTIPAGWNEWKCYAIATFFTGSGVSTAEVRMVIDGQAQQVQGPSQALYAVGGRRTGINTTGSRTIALHAREISGDEQMSGIFLYVRAARTS